MKKFKLEINGNIQILEGEVFYKSNLQDVTERGGTLCRWW